MSIGLRQSEIESIITRAIPHSFPAEQTRQVAKAIGAALVKNNEMIEKELNEIRELLKVKE